MHNTYLYIMQNITTENFVSTLVIPLFYGLGLLRDMGVVIKRVTAESLVTTSAWIGEADTRMPAEVLKISSFIVPATLESL